MNIIPLTKDSTPWFSDLCQVASGYFCLWTYLPGPILENTLGMSELLMMYWSRWVYSCQHFVYFFGEAMMKWELASWFSCLDQLSLRVVLWMREWYTNGHTREIGIEKWHFHVTTNRSESQKNDIYPHNCSSWCYPVLRHTSWLVVFVTFGIVVQCSRSQRSMGTPTSQHLWRAF